MLVMKTACLAGRREVPWNPSFTPNKDEKYCFALALSGGGSFGAYETGVVWGLLHYGDPDSYRWDVFTGVSAGSINAGMMSVWPKGSEVEMSENISHMVTVTTSDDTIASWDDHFLVPGPVEGYLYHAGLYDNSPMESYLNDYFANFTDIEKKLEISAVNVETGEFKCFDESITLKNLGRIIRASSSIPFAFPPTEFEGSLYMDGGTVWNINIDSAIDKCLELVDDEEHVVLDIAITETEDLPTLNSTGHSFSNFWRKHQIRKQYKVMDDIVEFARSRPNVNYRHFFSPS